MSKPESETAGPTRRQTRAQFDARLVLHWIDEGITPAQGWESVAEEAAQRLLMLEGDSNAE